MTLTGSFAHSAIVHLRESTGIPDGRRCATGSQPIQTYSLLNRTERGGLSIYLRSWISQSC